MLAIMSAVYFVTMYNSYLYRATLAAAVTCYDVLLSHWRHYTDLQRDCKAKSSRFPYNVPILYPAPGTVLMGAYPSMSRRVKKQEKIDKNFDKQTIYK